MKYAYFPGCSANSTGISFTLSADYVGGRIGLELEEIPDWCCCGTSAALVTSADLSLALPARSLALAEQHLPGLDVATPCAGCFASLKGAQHYVRRGTEQRAHVEQLIEMPYAATAEVYSFLEVMAQPEVSEQIASQLTTGLNGLKVASYYGCALVRPADVTQFEDPENPQSMDRLMELAGAEAISWAYKTECCGASHQISEPKGARLLVERIFADAAANGAEAIACACPLCLLNLDLREAEINATRQARGEQPFDIPIYYFTELLGAAMGGSAKQLGIDRHFWPAEALVQRAVSPSPAEPVLDDAGLKPDSADAPAAAPTAAPMAAPMATPEQPAEPAAEAPAAAPAEAAATPATAVAKEVADE
ncbi:MAG: CoB--CoM heterodisulfide reductase iron-sulfur subunit B family protein [Coriobacteriales bacterium]|jgi:heterodisulfide reductase subunit B|nr:CoB--CoM heterodisulfide reductase iron-sulfur subunit B family protein [Coriobacteriales bacterium]